MILRASTRTLSLAISFHPFSLIHPPSREPRGESDPTDGVSHVPYLPLPEQLGIASQERASKLLLLPHPTRKPDFTPTTTTKKTSQPTHAYAK